MAENGYCGEQNPSRLTSEELDLIIILAEALDEITNMLADGCIPTDQQFEKYNALISRALA